MNPGDNPPIGIVLCAEKNNTVVEYTLPKDEKQIFAAKYLTYLPTEEELRALLGNWQLPKLIAPINLTGAPCVGAPVNVNIRVC